MREKIQIGISVCLLGKDVRFNGGSLKPPLINEIFPNYFKYVPFCPEVEIGLGVPRETIRLEKKGGDVRLVGSKSGKDHTDKMRAYALEKVEKLAKQNICGYILKKDSPTCGMERVKIYDENKVPDKRGVGMFAETLMERFPLVPVEEEGRLNDIHLREAFVERVYALDRLKKFVNSDPGVGDLMAFHSRHKMQLMAHHPEMYRQLGRKLAGVRKDNFSDFLMEYYHDFMTIMNHRTTLKKQTDVLYHLLGFFKNDITSDEKQAFISLIQQYRKKMIPIIVPLTMIRHYLAKYPVEWLQSQIYLDPYPEELTLRSFM